MIELQGVTKIFPNGVRALNNINLTIKPGDFVFLVGPSGAGKSTFLRMLFREDKPTEGKIFIDGKIQSRTYQDQQGMQRHVTEIMADNMDILVRKSDSLKREEQNSTSTPKQTDEIPESPEEDIF